MFPTRCIARPLPPPVDPEPPRATRFDWLAHVARTVRRSKALQLALALAWLATKHQAPRVTLTRRTLAYWNLSRDAASDGLRALQAHRLLVVWRLPGRAPVVVLTEPGTTRPLQLYPNTNDPGFPGFSGLDLVTLGDWH